jgi:S1-C subfamily serine protease
MNERTRFALTAGGGCLALLVVVALVLGPLVCPLITGAVTGTPGGSATWTPGAGSMGTQQAVPTATASAPPGNGNADAPWRGESAPAFLSALYREASPGVVSIRVFLRAQGLTGQGQGSGFVLDEEGHIVTNSHVVIDADRITVVFQDGTEVEAAVVGLDDDSDLAVIKVDRLPHIARPLPIGESESVSVGDWVAAIGNPFGLGGSMSLGIVSATGRSIPSGAAGFRIPGAIQTDAAVNPGNSGGPLLNMSGQVVGVNAQIVSETGTGAGVGFAIPSDVVRRVAPVLIEVGVYQWPWLGVEGTSVDLLLAEANGLGPQRGAYIARVIEGGPAEAGGLRGSTGTAQVDGFPTQVGGDVVVSVDGEEVGDFDDLLIAVAYSNPGDMVLLTVIRGGERQEIVVRLEARPVGVPS